MTERNVIVMTSPEIVAITTCDALYNIVSLLYSHITKKFHKFPLSRRNHLRLTCIFISTEKYDHLFGLIRRCLTDLFKRKAWAYCDIN